MKFEDAIRKGAGSWAFRVSGDNLIAGNTQIAHIYTDTESFKIKDHEPEKYDNWMPLQIFPDYLPRTQNHDWHKDTYRKLVKEELDNKIQLLAEEINDKQST